MRALAFGGERLYAATSTVCCAWTRTGCIRTAPAEGTLYSLLQWRGALWVGGVGKLYDRERRVQTIDSAGRRGHPGDAPHGA